MKKKKEKRFLTYCYFSDREKKPPLSRNSSHHGSYGRRTSRHRRTSSFGLSVLTLLLQRKTRDRKSASLYVANAPTVNVSQ